MGLIAVALLAGCATVSLNEAPITDRSARRDAAVATPPSMPSTAPAPAPREAHDGQYLVQRGDTLYSIALAFGQDYRDLARWNGIDDPSRLQVGQSLRVQPPADGAGAAVAAVPVAPVVAAQVRPIDAPQPLPPVNATPVPAPVPGASPNAPAAPPAAVAGAAEVKPDARPAEPQPAGTKASETKTSETKASDAKATEPVLGWSWPASGKVIETFDDPRNKGIDIAGKEGD
ncbi:MAG: LysM peptidoglycan-binding domain-containing protein, partial [Burkholderiaceae bacterium]|nr:LysM peptidoglycan-binding domain-containing protein [Burkholderiaceae bacterium]